MSKAAKIMSNAKITLRPSAARGHADHGWLDTYHNRVAPRTGFPTHPHRDAEIFSYILSGELTHRDSMHGQKSQTNAKGLKDVSSDDYFVMKRGDVQFTTGGSGIAHAEQNEHQSQTVHFLQIWCLPWKQGLTPRYHTMSFGEEAKRRGFVTILSPLKGGVEATAEEEKQAQPVLEGTIPIHADFLMGASIIAPGSKASWKIGGDDSVGSKKDRKVYVHLPMMGLGAKVRLAGREDKVFGEGDGAFVENVNAGDDLIVESVGQGEAEVVVLDSN